MEFTKCEQSTDNNRLEIWNWLPQRVAGYNIYISITSKHSFSFSYSGYHMYVYIENKYQYVLLYKEFYTKTLSVQRLKYFNNFGVN